MATATMNTVLGVFNGSSHAAAFPGGLDTLQIISVGGKVIAKVDNLGNVSLNPASWTNGTTLGVFMGSGSTLAAIFGNAFPDASNNARDVYQVVNSVPKSGSSGGSSGGGIAPTVLHRIDSAGVKHTS